MAIKIQGTANAITFWEETERPFTLAVPVPELTEPTGWTLTFPSMQGLAGQTLVNDGAGNLSWASGGGGGGSLTLLSNATTNAEYFPIWSNVATGAVSAAFTSGPFRFNPGLGRLTTPDIVATTLRLSGATSGQISINAPSVAGTHAVLLPAITGSLLISPVTMVMPPNLGTTGYVMTTDGAGNLSWAVPPSGLPNGGSSTTVLVGPSGSAAWSSVDLATMTTGNLSVSSLNGGTGANSTTFWRGDGTWASVGGTFGSKTITADYTLALADASSSIQYNSTGGGTITIPTNAAVAFSIGTEIEVGQINTGALTIAASGGVTIDSPNGVYFNKRNQFARLRKIDTDTWSLGYYGFGARADLPAYAPVSISGVVSIDRNNGEVQRLSVTGNVTSLTIANFGTAGSLCKLVLEIWNTGDYSLIWPVGTIWPNGATPSITSGAGKKDIYILLTMDAGVTVYGTVVGQNYFSA